MQKWTPKQAARFGYLAGKGASLDTVRADPILRGRSAQSFSHASTRWHIPVNGAAATADAATLAVPIPPADLPVLEDAAAARGLSPGKLCGRSSASDHFAEVDCRGHGRWP
jgi:hypothetical protein